MYEKFDPDWFPLGQTSTKLMTIKKIFYSQHLAKFCFSIVLKKIVFLICIFPFIVRQISICFLQRKKYAPRKATLKYKATISKKFQVIHAIFNANCVSNTNILCCFISFFDEMCSEMYTEYKKVFYSDFTKKISSHICLNAYHITYHVIAKQYGQRK